MTNTIGASVGLKGMNKPADVKIIQSLVAPHLKSLNLPPIMVTGMADASLFKAIDQIQRKLLKLAMPDGRIDPGGKTLKFLVSPKPGMPPVVGTGAPAVTYKADVPVALRIVSDYAIKVIQRALVDAGMSAAVITSTLRLPAEQAQIMYGKAKQGLAAQYKLYGDTGDQVIDVFKENKGKPEKEVVALMLQKINDLMTAGKQVSRHVTTLEGYALLNVVDIGVGSTSAAAGPTFNQAKLTAAFNKLKTQGYIKNFIDETNKPNKCWHLEIAPNGKPL